jgi:hypothetical protein
MFAVTSLNIVSIHRVASKDNVRKRLSVFAYGAYLVLLFNACLILQRYGFVVECTGRPDHGLPQSARFIFNIVFLNVSVLVGFFVSSPTFDMHESQTRDHLLARISHDMVLAPALPSSFS